MKKILLLLMMLTLASLLIACSNAQDNTPQTNISVAVAVTESQTQWVDLETGFTSIGQVVAPDLFDVAPSTAGEVTLLQVQEGDFVQKGDVLYALDQTDVSRNLTTTESSLRTARNNLSLQYTNAKVLLDKQEVLLGQGAIAQAEVDQTRSQVATLKAQLNDASINYTNQVSKLRESLDDQVVISPVSGTIRSLDFKVGDVVNTQTFITITPKTLIHLETYLTAQQVKQVTLGQQVAIRPDENIEPFQGRVEGMSLTPHPQSGLYQVTLTLTEEQVPLLEGEYVAVYFSTGQERVSMVPLEAIKRIGSDTFVYTYTDNMAIRKEVTTGRLSGDLIEIKADDVSGPWLVKGISQLQNNTRIEIVQ